MKSGNDTIAQLLKELTQAGLAATQPNEFALETDTIYWRVVIESTRLVPHQVIVYLGAPEVSDFVRSAFCSALNDKGRGAFELQTYEQRAEVMPLVDPTSIEIHYSKDDDRQIRYQTGLFVERIAPLIQTVRSLDAYAAVLAADKDPFRWSRDHAALRIAAICYLAKRLDRAMPELPVFAERQFSADSANMLNTASLEDYIEFLRGMPLATIN